MRRTGGQCKREPTEPAASARDTVHRSTVSVARPHRARQDQSWSGWGDPSHRRSLPDGVLELLAAGLGVRSPGRPTVSIEDVVLPPSRLEAGAGAELSEVVGPANLLADREARVRHTFGKSTIDLLRMRAGRAYGAPDAVLTPGSHDEVLELLRICSRRELAVVPFGGGTSVVGGLEPDAEPFRAVLALDLRRFDALLGLDQESRLAEFEPGLRGPEAEALLGERGFTIGHFPQSFEYATLGGFAATRSSGQASAGYGRFDELVLALKAATPMGTLVLGRAPKSAAGPDLRQLILGSEGTLGVITSLTVQVRPAPEFRAYEGWRFGPFSQGMDSLRRLVQDGPLPTTVRLSDEAETAINLARPQEPGADGPRGGCLAILGYEGTAADVQGRRSGAAAVLERGGARPEPGAGEAWVRDRYQGPYLRDALLDAGALVETLETAAFWSRLPALYEAVSRALRESLAGQGTPPAILCHISHVYLAGASLYFTIACARAEDPVAQWRAAKSAAGEAVMRAGGSITHHHGVGTAHREWLEREVGALGVAALRAVKARLDPAGILNPGILLPHA
jgi:alkyldihydroxyacetonephosphate synthase